MEERVRVGIRSGAGVGLGEGGGWVADEDEAGERGGREEKLEVAGGG